MAAAPNTTITAGPRGLVTTKSVTFRFKSAAGATFKCKLDASSWKACASPTKYTRLKEGAHTFQVRASKDRARDRTPATRKFTVDTAKPNTTITDGVIGPTRNRTPTFVFTSSEPGKFECKLLNTAWAPCASPFVVSSPLGDDSFTFRVRARDKAGNVDPTPAAWAFSIDTPLSFDDATAQAAATLYFPDVADIDVPANCPSMDCPSGSPLAPANQLHVLSSRSLVKVLPNRFDVTVTQAVTTLQGFTLTVAGANCLITITSANGMSPTLTMYLSLQFHLDGTGANGVNFADRIDYANATMTGLEDADYTITGDLLCTLGAIIPKSLVVDAYVTTLLAQFNKVGPSFCPKPGPDYMGPCTPTSPRR
jgi:hypothetical protein